ncbi:MAG: 30S ribosomal protein S7 [Candidatus Aenigmarchaeota archaeon]|nr:30S ribosomal protein S7 [Candidatus Aenigmarchaeota archaeon]
MAKNVETPKLLLFDKWPVEEIEVKDHGLKRYLSVKPMIIPKTGGRLTKPFYKYKTNIVERLVAHIMQSGHSGKKHKITSGRFGGGFSTALKVVERALEIVEKRTKKNPLEVLIRAIENASIREEVASFQLGGIIARQAVVTSPQRRIDKTLRYFAQGAYHTAFNKKVTTAEALAEEIINAYEGSNKSFAVREKERIEQEAAGAR